MKPNLLSTLLFIAAVGIAMLAAWWVRPTPPPVVVVREYRQLELAPTTYGTEFRLYKYTRYSDGHTESELERGSDYIDAHLRYIETLERAEKINGEWKK